MIDISNNELSKAKLTGEWYTQSYHSYEDWDLKCRHIGLVYDSYHDYLWRIAEVTSATSNYPTVDEAFSQSNLHSVWGDDSDLAYNIVLSTDYEKY